MRKSEKIQKSAFVEILSEMRQDLPLFARLLFDLLVIVAIVERETTHSLIKPAKTSGHLTLIGAFTAMKLDGFFSDLGIFALERSAATLDAVVFEEGVRDKLPEVSGVLESTIQ